ncbi:MBL fold metallo-hydrolase [Gemmatimonas sp.]|uniref:MBL fold metallo-hydrolase n=1 Tax=Gemmatimonas sp. TaxID=1962908 RepID=UPI003F70B5EA
MGTTRYGDCIVITRGDRTILIDGAHRGDSNDVVGQLEEVLGHAAPFTVDLLVITHCHDDHIGQLPELVADGVLSARTVLAADERLGWGLSLDGRDGFADLPALQRGILTALLEEDRSDLPTDELEAFVQDAAKLIDRYTAMLDTLASSGARIIRYGRDAMVRVDEVGQFTVDATLEDLEREFADFGLAILGPTDEHLFRCAEAIASASDAMADRLTATDSSSSGATVYRRMVRRAIQDAFAGEDRPGIGAAKNNQSIVLKVAADGWSALLAGDMQFAKAEVSGLTKDMQALRQRVAEAGPYDFVKLTHHTSYNGVDESVLDEYAHTRLFAHTGGRRDATHPDPEVLALLKSRRADLQFARTDRNGRITVQKEQGAVVIQKSKGRFNDFAENQLEDLPEAGPALTWPSGATPSSAPAPAASSGAGVETVRREGHGQDVVEVVARVPNTATRVTLTIDVEPRGPSADSRGGERPRSGERESGAGLPDSRTMRAHPDLLFVTNRAALSAVIGRAECEQVVAMVGASGADLLELPDGVTEAEEAERLVRARLRERAARGVVLLGGFDVVPSQRLDVLDAPLRAQLRAEGREEDDADNFVVWSDELYGDSDGDRLPELPVSRIPDGRRAEVMLNALVAPAFTPTARYGIRNLHRPFARLVFPTIPGAGATLEVCEVYGPADVPPDGAAGAVYLMLHGSASDATRFWGETQGGGPYEAFAVENVPARAPGAVVLTGCCWGGLAMSPPASRVRSQTILRARGPEASIAVAYLQAGAQAFVGCTGSHYSPLQAPYNYFGQPMHDLFWREIAAGRPPAEALFRAKAGYAEGIPHGRRDAFSRAVELKILRQFTCLGLGW